MSTFSDRPRIEAAFAALSDRGIIARADFECCNSCAQYALFEQERTAWAGMAPAIGYVYFHEQATDSANDGGPLRLGHGAFAEDGDGVGVGHLIVSVLIEHGLHPVWDGDTDLKIVVSAPAGRLWRLDYPRPDGDED